MPKPCVIFDFDGVIADYGKPLLGLRGLLNWLKKKNIPCAIYSGATKDEILPFLDAFNLHHHFDAIVTIDDDPHSGRFHFRAHSSASFF